MSKTNLWQIITGLVMTAFLGIVADMGVWAVFPAMMAGMIWGGIASMSENDNLRSKTVFAKTLGYVMAGAVVMGGIILIGG